MIAFLLSVRQSFRLLLVMLYVGCIAALSLLPPNDLPKIQYFPGLDKMVHFMMYFIFSLLFCWTLRTEKHFLRLGFVVVTTIGWGVFMEAIQLYMHLGRNFSWYDILANSLGSVLGILIYTIVAKE
ncbi:MAG: VanZ family protein [Prolixibacteraceae bacterium]|nr:VanZ family protein [Prolixibacteraceae bacterium]